MRWSKPTSVLGMALIVTGAVGVAVLMNMDSTHCEFASEVFAQLRLCGSEYANDIRQARVVPVAVFVGLFGAGLLLLTR